MLLSGFLFRAKDNSKKQNNSMMLRKKKKNHFQMYHVTQSRTNSNANTFNAGDNNQLFFSFSFFFVQNQPFFLLLLQPFNLLGLSDFEKLFGVESLNAIVYCIVLHNVDALRYFFFVFFCAQQILTNDRSQSADNTMNLMKNLCRLNEMPASGTLF